MQNGLNSAASRPQRQDYSAGNEKQRQVPLFIINDYKNGLFNRVNLDRTGEAVAIVRMHVLIKAHTDIAQHGAAAGGDPQ